MIDKPLAAALEAMNELEKLTAKHMGTDPGIAVLNRMVDLELFAKEQYRPALAWIAKA